MRFRARVLAALAVAILTASCAGRGFGPMPYQPSTPTVLRTQAPRSSSATLEIRLTIPAKAHARAHYTSASTLGLLVALKAKTTTSAAFATAKGSPGCTSTATSRTCTLKLAATAGTYAATFTTYDLAPVAGKIPSKAHALSEIADPKYVLPAGTSLFKETLDGVPASISISGIPTATAGQTLVATTFSVMVKDADGNVIAGTYASPVTVADSDTSPKYGSGLVTSNNPPAHSVQLKASTQTVGLAYGGLAIAPATISASAAGTPKATATFAPALQPIVLTGTDTMNASFVGVDLYAKTGSGSTGSVNASETGWTNAPYSQALTATAAAGCSTIGTVAFGAGAVNATVVASPAAGSCTVTVSDGAKQSTTFPLYYTAFAASGSAQSLTIPAGVTTATMTLAGAQGASSTTYNNHTPYTGGGLGGQTQATVPLTASETLDIVVGTQAGFNGGGAAGSGVNAGGNGGGESDVREGGTGMDNRILVAGGGGGAGGSVTMTGNAGGAGGGQSAAAGGGTDGGGAATQYAAGAGGNQAYSFSGPGAIGGIGTGGAGGAQGSQYGNGAAGGGGGAGYFGGGGGGGGIGNATYFAPSAGGGGGGGSSYAEGTATNVTLSQGVQSGDGFITIVF